MGRSIWLMSGSTGGAQRKGAELFTNTINQFNLIQRQVEDLFHDFKSKILTCTSQMVSQTRHFQVWSVCLAKGRVASGGR